MGGGLQGRLEAVVCLSLLCGLEKLLLGQGAYYLHTQSIVLFAVVFVTCDEGMWADSRSEQTTLPARQCDSFTELSQHIRSHVIESRQPIVCRLVMGRRGAVQPVKKAL